MLYFDHNATTPVLPEVREAMLPYLGEAWGNPSSSYHFGSQLKSKIEAAREQTAALVGARFPREVLFTSGGTENNNTAIHAAILSRLEKQHIVTSLVEHSSVLTSGEAPMLPQAGDGDSASRALPEGGIIRQTRQRHILFLHSPMTIALPPALHQLVERLIRTGRYADEGDVVREALRMLEHQEFDESPALEAALLEGVRSGHQAYDHSTLDRVRQNASA